MDVWLLISRDGCMSVKIRVSFQSQSGVRTLNPKRTNLYHIVILCVSQPRNGRRLPGPPVYTSFWGDGKPPWLGGPKAHSPHDMFMDAGFESHGNRTSPHHPVGLLRWPRQRWLRCAYMGRPVCKSVCVYKWLCVKALVCKTVCV